MTDRDQVQARTKLMALRVIKLVDALPKSAAGRAIASQLVRSATSVGANYRAARRGRSKREYIAKLGVVLEEADETLYWLELIIEAGLLPQRLVEPLRVETEELVRIFAATRRTALAKSPHRQIAKLTKQDKSNDANE